MKVQLRWLRVVAAVVGVAVGLAALSWYVVLPHYRPPLRPERATGSTSPTIRQGSTGTPSPPNGIAFAYAKASEGGDFRDRQFADNWEAARTAGLDVGAYHFFTREVDTFLTMVESAWQMPVLMYVGDDWESRYPTLNGMDRPQWHLRFLRRPSETSWDVWQIHGFAHVEGIEGRVDLDVGRPGLSAAGSSSLLGAHVVDV